MTYKGAADKVKDRIEGTTALETEHDDLSVEHGTRMTSLRCRRLSLRVDQCGQAATSTVPLPVPRSMLR